MAADDTQGLPEWLDLIESTLSHNSTPNPVYNRPQGPQEG